jgi:hypothetical protein
MEETQMSDPALIEACKLWDKITDKLNLFKEKPSRLYFLWDYERLTCKIEGDKAELTVGSSPGHKIHVDLGKGKVLYYDKDDDVSLKLKALLDERIKCNHIEGEGLECSGLTRENVKDVFKTLSAATSMDLRLKKPEDFWGFPWEMEVLECKGYDEVCLIKKAIEQAEKAIEKEVQGSKVM